MKYSQIKQIKSFCESLDSSPDWREVVKEIEQNSNDFEVNDVRFIAEDDIQNVLEDELAADEYILGCFNSWAIAEATGWPEFLIKAAQEGEQYEAIGAAMTGEHVANLAYVYSSQDGYGHHFNRYDGNEEEIQISGYANYFVFDNH